MPALITAPSSVTKWNSVYQKILFGLPEPFYSWTWTYSSVVSVNGKAKFIMDTGGGINPYGTPNCKFIWVSGGIYAGCHVVQFIDTLGNVLTNTNFTATNAASAKALVNLIFRVQYGYPTQPKYIDIAPIWIPSEDNLTASLISNIGAYLQSVFKIIPPTIGYDDNMYTHFSLKVLPNKDFAKFLIPYMVATGFSEEQSVKETITSGYVSPVWYAANSTCTHARLNLLTGDGDTLSPEAPILFGNGCAIFSKIITDRIYNVLVCQGEALDNLQSFLHEDGVEIYLEETVDSEMLMESF